MATKEDDIQVPDTIERSPAKAQRTYKKTLRSAKDQYGEGERAERTAFAALKNKFEKVGDHWEPKDGSGPSDSRSEKSTKEKRQGKGETYGGVDVEGNSEQELYERAKKLDIDGRSQMNKKELAKAISKKQG